MTQAYIDEFLAIDTKEILKRQLRSSYVRTVLAFGSLGLTAFLVYRAFVHGADGALFLAMFLAIFAFLLLIGHTPRRGLVFSLILTPRAYWPTSTIHDNATKRARVAAAKSAIRSGDDLEPEAFRMRRRLSILFISRLLGGVAMAMLWVAIAWYSQHSQRAAHFERFGTYDGVSIHVHLDGTETITRDPSLGAGSYRRTMEQPPRPLPVAPRAASPVEPAAVAAVAPVTTPEVKRAPIVPPNPPLPSYWPPITPGYSATIYDRTASGALTIVEIRLQYTDGKMHAVGP